LWDNFVTPMKIKSYSATVTDRFRCTHMGWFNIPAPALVKMKSDVGAEMSCRLKVTVAQADVEATAETDSLKEL
jgi:hypothetical protein